MRNADFSDREETDPRKKADLFTTIRFFATRRESRKRAGTLASGGNILVLCLGNICRSPVVETLLKNHLPKDRYQIRSRGLLPLDSQPSPLDYAKEARSLGIELEHHRSNPLSDEDISWATAIVIMDPANHNGLRPYGEEALSKTVWIGAWDPSGDIVIPDPFREPPALQREIILRMKKACHHFSTWLLHRGGIDRRKKVRHQTE